MHIRFSLVCLLLFHSSLLADDPEEPGQAVGQDPPEFVLKDDVRDALFPLFAEISKANVSRATVDVLADSLVGGTVMESQESTYQIASTQPNKFTIYLKEPAQRTRIYCDGKSMDVALAPDAYIRFPDALDMQQAVTALPVPMGPYPELVLALTLAGVDPAISMIEGMESIEVVDRKDFRGKVPAIHLRGVQADAVTWDFWMTSGEKPRPLRLLVDLTPMLVASNQMQIPVGFSYQLRFDFLSWRVGGEVDQALFKYTPANDAVEFESLEDYYESVAGVVEEHPLLGKPAPPFRASKLDGEEFDSNAIAGMVVVLDFWATWCTPCLAAMPVIKEVTDEFGEKDVLFLALNTGEEKPEIDKFLKQHKLDLNVLLDPDGKVADAFRADAIPQTIVIGKSGIIESVHIGFPGEDALKQRLKDELDVLSIGGKIGSLAEEPESSTQD